MEKTWTQEYVSMDDSRGKSVIEPKLVRASKTKKKPNACSECYRLKKTCNYDAHLQNTSIKSCDRCLRLDKVCIPRVIIRGKRRKKKDLATVDQKESSASSSTTESKKPIDQTSEAEFEELGAYDSLTLTSTVQGDLKTSQWWRAAVRAVGATEKAPPCLEAYVHCLILVGKQLKSMVRMHHAIALAAATNVHVERSFFSSSLQPLAPEVVEPLQCYFEQNYVSQSVPCIVSRIIQGKREFMVSHAYDFLIEKTQTFHENSSGDLQQAVIEMFARVASPQAAKKVMAGSVMTCLRKDLENGGALPGVPRVEWYFETPEFFQVQGRDGALFSARLGQGGMLAYNGRLSFFLSSFRDLTPLNAIAQQMLHAFQGSTLQHYDSAPIIPPVPPGMESSMVPDADFLEMLEDFVNRPEPASPFPHNPEMERSISWMLFDLADADEYFDSDSCNENASMASGDINLHDFYPKE